MRLLRVARFLVALTGPSSLGYVITRQPTRILRIDAANLELEEGTYKRENVGFEVRKAQVAGAMVSSTHWRNACTDSLFLESSA